MARKKRVVARRKRSLFGELMSGVEAIRAHREGQVTLKRSSAKRARPAT